MDPQRLDTRPKAAWVSGLREPASPAPKKRQRQKHQQPLETPPPPTQQLQQLRSFADLGPAERQRLAELVSELGRLGEAKARAERGLVEERQLRLREVDNLRADLERQRRALAELETRLSASSTASATGAAKVRRGPRSVASQCDELLPPPQPLPPPPPAASSDGRRRAFTDRIDREIGAAASAKPKPGDDDDAIVALLRQQLLLTDRTQRHLCRQLRELSGLGVGKPPAGSLGRPRAAATGDGRVGGGGNRILREPHADSADEFFVLPEVLGPPPPPRNRPAQQPRRPPPRQLLSPRPDSLLDIVESLDGPQFDEDQEEGEGETLVGFGYAEDREGAESGDDDSGVLEDLFFLS